MDPIRAAIVEILESDAQLTALATGGVHWRSAEEGAQPPLVIVDKYAGSRTYAFDDSPLHNTGWTVKGVGFSSDAEDIDKRCQTLLAGADLPGVSLRLAPMREDDVSYQEDSSGELYDHVGTNYRVVDE